MKKKVQTKKPQATKASSKELKSSLFVVGIGSSAGGLEALRSLFASLKARGDMTYVVVQHLAPLHRSRMVEILSHSTKMKVLEVTDNLKPEPSVIYVTPPNSDVFFKKGVLRLSDPHQKIGPKPSVDLFFESLAENFQERAIGIILSGTGSDGSMGIRSIKASGGLTISQEVSSAKYEGMPRAANLTGQVDMLLPPDEIAIELERYTGIIDDSKINSKKNDVYDQILEVVNQKKGSNFDQYKQSTIRRRIERRMIATRSDSLKDYLQFIEKNTDEVQNLFQDILISVTSFFRDDDAYKALRQLMMEKIRQKKDGAVFRSWIIGCATGEEAYSIAIMFHEVLRDLGKELPLQLFATDLDENALSIARRGVYSANNLGKVPEDIRKRYFQPMDDKYQIKTFVRDSIVFARQNVTDDPPFLNTDLISCRNVLIYFNPKLQLKVFQTIRYSLDPQGILFLGKSENIPGEYAKAFKVADKITKLYISSEGKGQMPSFTSSGALEALSRTSVKVKKEDKAIPLEAYSFMIEAFAPHSVLVDSEQNVRHIFGDLSNILKLPKGQATFSLSKMLPPILATEVSTLLMKVRKSEQPARGMIHEIKRGKKIENIQIVVTSASRNPNREFLVAFVSLGSRPEVKSQQKTVGSSQRTDKLLQELTATRNHLQALQEENATNNEELQAVNEELQSTNEELQSSNEELETTNEELQSSNEELTTLNQELNVKTSEVQILLQRNQAVQNAIGYPLLTIDTELTLLNLNPAARYFLKLGEVDIGSSLRTSSASVELTPIIESIEKALRSRKDNKIQYELKDRTFEIQTQLFTNEKEIIEGAVVSFMENSEIVKALSETKLIKSRLSSIIDNTPALVTIKDLSGVYTFVNSRFEQTLKRTNKEIIGFTDDELFPAELARSMRTWDLACMDSSLPVDFDQTMNIEGEVQHWHITKFLLIDPKNRPYSICTMCFNISDRAAKERELRIFRRSVANALSGTVIIEVSRDVSRVTFCSDGFMSRLGLDYAQMLNLQLEEFLMVISSELDEADAQIIARKMMENKESSQTLRRVSRNTPGLMSIELKSLMSKDADGRLQVTINLYDISQAVSDQKTIFSQQEDLIRYGRFSTLGEIAAGISHEINTPLNVITAKTDLLRKSVQLGKLNGDMVTRLADDISGMAKNISTIVYGLKNAAGVQSDKFEIVEVRKILVDALKICDFKAQRAGVAVKLQPISKEIKINCFPVQIMQICINLINNSIEAVSELPKKWMEISILRPSSDVIYIQFRDSGEGISPDIAQKIMTPFFTTKKDQNGTGLGLSLSRTIAINHGGDLIIDLENPHTTFILKLPTVDKE